MEPRPEQGGAGRLIAEEGSRSFEEWVEEMWRVLRRGGRVEFTAKGVRVRAYREGKMYVFEFPPYRIPTYLPDVARGILEELAQVAERGREWVELEA